MNASTCGMKRSSESDLSSRQCEGDPCAALRLALGPDPAAVGFDDPTGDRQTQPGAAGGARARLLTTVEVIEDPRQVVGRDALAGVGDLHDDRPFDPSTAPFDKLRGDLGGAVAQGRRRTTDNRLGPFLNVRVVVSGR